MKKLFSSLLLLISAICVAHAEDLSGSVYARENTTYQNIHYSASNSIPSLILGQKSIGLNGFATDVMVGVPLSSSLPMHIEFGPQFQFGWGLKELNKSEWNNEKYNTFLFRINVPLRYIYHIPCGDKVNISPYAGIDFRFNIVSTGSTEFYANQDRISKVRLNYFDKSEMNDETFKRFQMGWHVGVAFEFYNTFVVSANYGTDFMPIYNSKLYNSKIRTANLSVGLGYYLFN